MRGTASQDIPVSPTRCPVLLARFKLPGDLVEDENGEQLCQIHGKSVEQVLREEPSYYAWMLNGDFPLYTKKILTDIKLRMAFNR